METTFSLLVIAVSTVTLVLWRMQAKPVKLKGISIGLNFTFFVIIYLIALVFPADGVSRPNGFVGIALVGCALVLILNIFDAIYTIRITPKGAKLVASVAVCWAICFSVIATYYAYFAITGYYL